MPASLAVRAHWSVSHSVALKKPTSLTPGVHSLPEKVLNDQQMNMPHFRFASSSRRFCMSTGSAAWSSVAAMTIPATNTVTDRLMGVSLHQD